MLQTLRKPVLFIVGTLVLYALCGFFVLPAVLEAKIPELIEQQTGRKASIGKVTFNPFSLEFALEHFAIQESDDQPFAAFDALTANFEGIESISHWALAMGQVDLVKPFVRIARTGAGTFNFSDLVKKEQAPVERDETEGLFPLLIRNLTISEGSGLWEDLQFKKPEKETIAPFDLSISELSTLGSDPSGMRLSLTLSSGARLEWTGDIVLQPLQSTGVLKLEQLSLPRLWKLFLKKQAPFQLEDGAAMIAANYEFGFHEEGFSLALGETKTGIEHLNLTGRQQAAIPDVTVKSLSFTADYRIDQNKQGFKVDVGGGRLIVADMAAKGTPAIEIPDIKFQKLDAGLDTVLSFDEKTFDFSVKQGYIRLSRFDLAETTQKDKLIEIPNVAVQGIRVDGTEQKVNISSIDSQDARIKAWLNPDGTSNFQNLFSVSKASDPSSGVIAPEKTDKPWEIDLDKATVKNYQIDFTDKTQTKPVAVGLTGLAIELENFSTKSGASVPLKLRSMINEAGEIKLNGETALSPLKADLAVEVSDIGLKMVQPYLEKYVRLDIVEGDLSTQGRLSLAMVDSGPLSLTYQGNANVAHLLTRDQIQNKDFVKWNNLELGKISVDLAQQTYGLEAVVFDQPYARMIIKKDGSTNINDILVPQTPEPAVESAAKPAPSGPKRPTFAIGKIRVKQGMSDFADYSLILPFVTQMNSLEGTLIGLSSDTNATAKLALKGKVYDLANVDIAGQYQIGTGDSTVMLTFKNMPLPLVTPYMAEFAGYKIEKGQMSLDLNYTVNKGKLEAQNNLFIDQFTLGEKVENPDAVSLPLNLAIALLKDSEGKINLDLPITGSLEDPEFSVGALVFKALGNLLAKIVTSPFQAIAGLVGNGQDLSEVGFSAGSADLDMVEQVKLSKLAEALSSRPSLTLDIKGAAYQEYDWPEMRFDALKDQLKKLKAKELKAEGKKIRSEYVELSEDDYKRLLAKVFIEKFPLLAEYSFFGNPQLKDSEAGDFYEVARRQLEAIMQPEKQRLDNLAMLRASNIAKYIIEQGGIAEDRVFILATELDPEKEEPGITVSLSLNIAP